MYPISRLKIILRNIRIRNQVQQLVPRVSEESWQDGSDYHLYLENQLTRTLAKIDNEGVHTQILIDQIASFTNLEVCDVLCVGCRNMVEIEYFQKNGASNVVGVDLYAPNPAILVMDMHQLDFSDQSFDVVFSSHSLEHSYDAEKVVSELARVGRPNAILAIEVPVEFSPTAADRVDFGSLKNLHDVFSPYISEILWSDAQPAQSPTNIHNVAIIRTIMRVG